MVVLILDKDTHTIVGDRKINDFGGGGNEVSRFGRRNNNHFTNQQ